MTRFIGLSPPRKPALPVAPDQWRGLMHSLDHFARVFAIRADERVLLLSDPLLDTRVIDLIRGICDARGATLKVLTETSTRVEVFPTYAKALLDEADFVVSTWFCSIIDPLCIAARKRGQRWVKITYFRDFDLLHTAQSRFPPELVGSLIRATAQRMNRAGFEMCWRGESDFSIRFTPEMVSALLAGNRWRGKMLADEPGCYVHYLPTHGPNLWDRTAHHNDNDAPVTMGGWIYPEWAVGFEKPWAEKIGVRFEGDTVREVSGEGETAAILRDMLLGGRLIELGCGFNPQAPRHTIYPAGSNAPGALHFGIDLAKPSDYIRRVMPDWEEPPVHMDLVMLNATVDAGDARLIDAGFLTALRDAEVIEAAGHFGDPVALLETVV